MSRRNSSRDGGFAGLPRAKKGNSRRSLKGGSQGGKKVISAYHNGNLGSLLPKCKDNSYFAPHFGDQMTLEQMEPVFA
jgi:hypothetical protein